MHVASTPSTNDLLKAHIMAHPEAAEGLTVTTTQQTAGRGQRGRTWTAEPGQNLTASILLKPTFLAANDLFYLNKALALAVRDTLAGKLPEVQVKWPNDIYAEGRKLAGLLIETSISNRVQWVIAGVGINVNQMQFGPSAPLAASLAMLSGERVPVEVVLDTLCVHIEHRYLQLRAGHLAEIDQQYHQHLLGFGKQIRYQHRDLLHLAICKGVDAQGHLIVQDDGEEVRYGVGEINWDTATLS